MHERGYIILEDVADPLNKTLLGDSDSRLDERDSSQKKHIKHFIVTVQQALDKKDALKILEPRFVDRSSTIPFKQLIRRIVDEL